MRKDEELTRLEYLGQKLAEQKPILRDYALNVNADKVVAIDILIEALPKGSKKRKVLEKVREILIRQGEALYIMQSDIFTNLCIKVGSTVKVIDWFEE